jgi:hypothetical protein
MIRPLLRGTPCGPNTVAETDDWPAGGSSNWRISHSEKLACEILPRMTRALTGLTAVIRWTCTNAPKGIDSFPQFSGTVRVRHKKDAHDIVGVARDRVFTTAGWRRYASSLKIHSPKSAWAGLVSIVRVFLVLSTDPAGYLRPHEEHWPFPA